MIEKRTPEVYPSNPHEGRETFRAPEKAVETARPEMAAPIEQPVRLAIEESMPAPVSVASYDAQDDYKKIENILEEDLADVYFKMTPLEQENFKVKGEQAAKQIAVEMARPKFKLKKIIVLIRSWLKTISGMNMFFIEQLVKIKTDKIIALRQKITK